MLTYENLSFSLSIGAFAGLYKFMLCFLRWLRNKDDSKNTFLASLFGSLSLLLDTNKTRRTTFMYLMLCRALDCVKNLLTTHTRLKKIPYFEILVMNMIGFFMWLFYSTDYKAIGDQFIDIFDKSSMTKWNEWLFMRCIYQRPRWSTPFK